MQVQHREFRRAPGHGATGAPHATLNTLYSALVLRFMAARLRTASTAIARATGPALPDRVRTRLCLLAALALAAAACVGAVYSFGALARLLLLLLLLLIRLARLRESR